MSRIYWHSEDEDTAEVHGSERAHAGVLCSDLLVVSLGVNRRWIDDRDIAAYRRVVTGYVKESSDHRFVLDFQSWLSGIGENYFLINGRDVSVFTAALNTAYVLGSDPMKLLARLHGQCELHCYVEGANRAWLADIIERGRTVGIMRKDSGWESVVTLLRSRNDSPVVTSYSVCEQFPNSGIASWQAPEDEDGELNYDAWYDLPDEDRWSLAIAGLRKRKGGLELKPGNWNTFYFGSGVNGFHILEHVYSLHNDTNSDTKPAEAPDTSQ